MRAGTPSAVRGWNPLGEPCRATAGPARRMTAGAVVLYVALWASGLPVVNGCTRSAERDAPARCPVVPLGLVVETPGSQPVEILSVDARGVLRGGPAGGQPELARLDGRGCLTGDDGVWVELTSGGELWTLRQVFAVDGETLLVGGKRARIAPDGSISFTGPDGATLDDRYGSFRLTGYRPEAACAARILLVTYLSMMPSMAVVDGNPRTLPPPEDSLCR